MEFLEFRELRKSRCTSAAACVVGVAGGDELEFPYSTEDKIEGKMER